MWDVNEGVKHVIKAFQSIFLIYKEIDTYLMCQGNELYTFVKLSVI